MRNRHGRCLSLKPTALNAHSLLERVSFCLSLCADLHLDRLSQHWANEAGNRRVGAELGAAVRARSTLMDMDSGAEHEHGLEQHQ